MCSVSLLLCLLMLLAAGCTSTFNGYRQTPQTPADILQGDDVDDAFPVLIPVESPGATPSATSNVTKPATPASQPAPKADAKEDRDGVHLRTVPGTAIPFQPTEYRRVWIAPHQNQFGDAVHGHTCDILFKEAMFRPQPVPDVPPTAPVILRKEEKHTPPPPFTSPQMPYQGSRQSVPGRTAVPIHLQDYLRRMGVGNVGQ